MCGVAGAFCQPDGVRLAQTMTDRIGYRGPDASGLEDMSPLRRMVADQRSGRRDQFKQLWQVLSMELSYREAPAAGVALL